MEISIYDLAVVPLIIALAQVIQRIGIKERYIPMIDVLLGVLIGIFYLSDGDMKKGIFLGVWVGLAATGLLNGTKITVNGTFKKRNGNVDVDNSNSDE